MQWVVTTEGSAVGLGVLGADVGQGRADAAVEVGHVDAPSSSSTSDSWRNPEADRATGKWASGSRTPPEGSDRRCTRTPSSTSGPGVAVTTTTRWPARCRWTGQVVGLDLDPPMLGR